MFGRDKTPGTEIAPANSKTAVAAATHDVTKSGELVIPDAPLAKQLGEGIKCLVVAFQAGTSGLSDEDRKLSLKIYRKALEGLPEAVNAYALEWLLMHNPRNPFPPSPQDVRETCQRVLSVWQGNVLDYYLGSGDWGGGYSLLGKANIDLGPSPDEEGCRVPEVLIAEWLRKALPGLLSDDGSPEPRICGLSQKQLDHIPADAWPDGVKEKAIAIRKDVAEKRAAYEARMEAQRRKREEIEAFIDSQPYPLSSHCREALKNLRQNGEPTDTKMILEVANRLMAERTAHYEKMREAERKRSEEMARRKELSAKLDQWLAIPEDKRPELDDPELADLNRLRELRAGMNRSASLADTPLVRGH